MKVSLVVPYYDNPGMLAKQYEMLVAYPAQLKKQLEFVVVDDGSPRWPAAEVKRPDGLPKLRLFRILVDVRWNQDAAHNIGVHESRHPWLLVTDIDHLVPAATMARLCIGLHGSYVYTFARISAPDMAPYKPHPNSWSMHRAMWKKIGGYDERFAGYYGTDADFRRRVLRTTQIVPLPEILIRVPREVIPDASTTTYARREPFDHPTIRKIRDERDAMPGWRPLQLTFPYERML